MGCSYSLIPWLQQRLQATVEIRVWMSNYIPHKTMDSMAYSYVVCTHLPFPDTKARRNIPKSRGVDLSRDTKVHHCAVAGDPLENGNYCWRHSYCHPGKNQQWEICVGWEAIRREKKTQNHISIAAVAIVHGSAWLWSSLFIIMIMVVIVVIIIIPIYLI